MSPRLHHLGGGDSGIPRANSGKKKKGKKEATRGREKEGDKVGEKEGGKLEERGYLKRGRSCAAA